MALSHCYSVAQGSTIRDPRNKVEIALYFLALSYDVIFSAFDWLQSGKSFHRDSRGKVLDFIYLWWSGKVLGEHVCYRLNSIGVLPQYLRMCHYLEIGLLQMEVVQFSVLVAQSYLTHRHPTVCSLPGSSVHGILQARILEWVTILFSKVSSQPKD